MPTGLGWTCIALGSLCLPNISSVLYYTCCIYPVETAHKWMEENQATNGIEVVVCQPGVNGSTNMTQPADAVPAVTAAVVSEPSAPGN
jgi:hypothetical protein